MPRMGRGYGEDSGAEWRRPEPFGCATPENAPAGRTLAGDDEQGSSPILERHVDEPHQRAESSPLIHAVQVDPGIDLDLTLFQTGQSAAIDRAWPG